MVILIRRNLLILFLAFTQAGKMFQQRVFTFPTTAKTTVDAKISIAADVAKSSRQQTILAALSDPGDNFAAMKRENGLLGTGAANPNGAGAGITQCSFNEFDYF